MLIVTTVVAWLALLLAIVTFVMHVSANRNTNSSSKNSVWDDDDLLQTVWLQEIEARGQAVLEQLADAEKRLREQTSVQTSVQTAEQDVAGTSLEDAEIVGGTPVVRDRGEAAVQHVQQQSDQPDETLIHPVEDAAEDASAKSDSVQPDNLPERIWHLAENGHDVATIARTVGVGLGEVELMLALQRPETKVN